MKKNNLILVLMALFTLVLTVPAMAQPEPRGEGERGPREHRPRQTPEMIATRIANEMTDLVGLTEKQYNKVLKLYTESETAMQEKMIEILRANNMGGHPGMGRGGERPQGERPQGMEQGGERRERPQGMGQDGERRERPQGERGEGRRPMMMDPAVMQAIQAQVAEERAAQEAKDNKKLKKILKADQFEEWMNRERPEGPQM